MRLAWQFVKRNGASMKQALIIAWRNAKLKIEMAVRIVKFFFQKIDGTTREAFGTLNSRHIAADDVNAGRKKNDTVQVYWDSEKQAWRSFKIFNLLLFNCFT